MFLKGADTAVHGVLLCKLHSVGLHRLALQLAHPLYLPVRLECFTVHRAYTDNHHYILALYRM